MLLAGRGRQADDAECEGVHEASAREMQLVLGHEGREVAHAVVREADAIGKIEEGDLALRAQAPKISKATPAGRRLKPIHGAKKGPAEIGDNLAEGEEGKGVSKGLAVAAGIFSRSRRTRRSILVIVYRAWAASMASVPAAPQQSLEHD